MAIGTHENYIYFQNDVNRKNVWLGKKLKARVCGLLCWDGEIFGGGSGLRGCGNNFFGSGKNFFAGVMLAAFCSGRCPWFWHKNVPVLRERRNRVRACAQRGRLKAGL